MQLPSPLPSGHQAPQALAVAVVAEEQAVAVTEGLVAEVRAAFAVVELAAVVALFDISPGPC